MTVSTQAFLAIENSLSSRLLKEWEAHSLPLTQSIWGLMKAGKKTEAVDAANAIDLEYITKNNIEYINYLGNAALVFGATRVVSDPRLTQIARGKHSHVVRNATTLLCKAIVQNVEEAIRKALLTKIAEWDTAEPTTHFAPSDERDIMYKFDPNQPRDTDGKWVGDGSAHLPDSLGIERKNMPQISQADMAEFISFAKGKGVKVVEEKEVAGKLKPAQNEYNPAHAKQMPDEWLNKPITVSRDNYVLDGTNRWKRLVNDNPKQKINVRRIGLPAKRALVLMHSFPKAFSKDITMVGARKAELGDYVEPFQSFQGDIFSTGSDMLAITSSLHTSRLSAFGFTVEAEVRNLGTYRINAQLDSHVCPVCEIISERVFPIDSATKLLRDALGANDPNDLKTIAPWPPQDKRSVEEIAALSDDELIARGWNVPPFHPWCRCILVPVDEGVGASDTASAQAALGRNDPLQPEVVSGAALGNLTVSEMNSARDDMAGLAAENAASEWNNLLAEGYTTAELEDIFGVLEEDVLAGRVAFPS